MKRTLYPKTPCPRCNSPQKFVQKRRDTDKPGVFEVYYACSKCRYERTLRRSTEYAEQLRTYLLHLIVLGESEWDNKYEEKQKVRKALNDELRKHGIL